MNRFSDASLRGGIPKTNKMMKKYITPNTETIEAIYGSVICHSNDGEQVQTNPTTPGQGGQTPLGAPGRVF